MKDIKELRKQFPESFLLEYIDRCKSGEIIVGHENRFEALLL